MKKNWRADGRRELPKKEGIFAQIERWLPDVALLCSRIEGFAAVGLVGCEAGAVRQAYVQLIRSVENREVVP